MSTVTVLAALWVILVRCGVSSGSPGPGCDNGKLSLDRDMPPDALYWDCPGTIWPESIQRRPSIDTVNDPVPARQLCMDEPISYNQSIPSSGAYRPVRAESGEYLYCPPQRWLNNLHHGATVLLYHPCVPLHERLLLSVLARSCLPDYIVSAHPRLKEHMPIALVSWGHTLELSTAWSSDVYDWLETTASTRKKFVGVNQSRKYNLLLTRSGEQRRRQHANPEEQESLRRCFERAVSSQLNGAMETVLQSNIKSGSWKLVKEDGKRRRLRAAIKEIWENGKKEREDIRTHQSNRTTISRTEAMQNNFTVESSTDSPPASRILPDPPGSRTLPDPPGSRTLPDPPGSSEAPSQSKIQNTNQGLPPRPTTPLESLQTAAQQPKHADLRNPLAGAVNREQNQTARPEALALSSKDEGTDSVKQGSKDFGKHSLKGNVSKANIHDKHNTAGGTGKGNEVVDVKERELERKQKHSDTHSQHKSEKTGFDPVSKPQSEPQPQNPQPTGHPPNSHDCAGCKAGERCECNEDSDAADNGLLRTQRTDEAVWAAAALGFLLILLTLSVLHTRLYRHWRTTPSLYWRDPQRDYDSVADVIRRRLRIANKRHKRSRRRECVLLPSSSSSDEHP
ncbi:uncharacterized protein tp53i13 [Cebidichthys violaceus]|uniref:uncharacterized protein tp53i13 n=1 Tax=Cebidichthys violaceus TaxID=271503 RepID=UPI0035CAF8B6